MLRPESSSDGLTQVLQREEWLEWQLQRLSSDTLIEIWCYNSVLASVQLIFHLPCSLKMIYDTFLPLPDGTLDQTLLRNLYLLAAMQRGRNLIIKQQLVRRINHLWCLHRRVKCTASVSSRDPISVCVIKALKPHRLFCKIHLNIPQRKSDGSYLHLYCCQPLLQLLPREFEFFLSDDEKVSSGVFSGISLLKKEE